MEKQYTTINSIINTLHSEGIKIHRNAIAARLKKLYKNDFIRSESGVILINTEIVPQILNYYRLKKFGNIDLF